MTIDQQLRDRFDRATDRSFPTVDLDAAIDGGRRARRRRAASYAAGSVAVAAVAAVAAGSAFTALVGSEPSTTSPEVAATDTSYVPGTNLDERLAASVAADLPVLPAPSDVYPLDWQQAGNPPGYAAPYGALRLPDDQFAGATGWQLRYDIAAGHTVLITVGLPVDGVLPDFGCDADGLLTIGAAGGTTGWPTCVYQHDKDHPSTWAFLTVSGGASDDGAVFTALTERVGPGTEAEGRAQALFPEGTYAGALEDGLEAALQTP